MNVDIETDKLERLEDFIALARKGGPVTIDIELKKQLIKEKVHPDESDDMTDELDMYLLSGEFVCGSAGEIVTITKVYVMGSIEESLVASSGNKNIANQRLRMDYGRLKDAGIQIKEKFF